MILQLQRGRRLPTRKGEPAKYSEPTKEDIERAKKLRQQDEAFLACLKLNSKTLLKLEELQDQ